MKKLLTGLGLLAAVLTAFAVIGAGDKAAAPPEPANETLAVATFAGGCFWCVEPISTRCPAWSRRSPAIRAGM